MIQITGLTKTYPGKQTPAVDTISLEVKSGEVFGFLGPNGAGKTTTVKMLVGLMQPTAGDITIFQKSPGDFRVKQRIGFLPEQPYFYRSLTALEFLEMCAELFAIPATKRAQTIIQILQEVFLPAEAWDRTIRTYSKGMQQRLGLAQALINDPELVILDEPMSGLDPLGRKEVKDLILNLQKKGKTVFFNSHILADVEDLCDRVAIIDQGKIILEGAIEKLTKKGTISLEQVFVTTLTAQRS